MQDSGNSASSEIKPIVSEQLNIWAPPGLFAAAALAPASQATVLYCTVKHRGGGAPTVAQRRPLITSRHVHGGRIYMATCKARRMRTGGPLL